jgi:hypothetical protein
MYTPYMNVKSREDEVQKLAGKPKCQSQYVLRGAGEQDYLKIRSSNWAVLGRE